MDGVPDAPRVSRSVSPLGQPGCQHPQLLIPAYTLGWRDGAQTLQAAYLTAFIVIFSGASSCFLSSLGAL